MPITRKQFDLGIDDAVLDGMKTVHAFLSANRDKAYTEDELVEEALKGLEEGKPSEILVRAFTPAWVRDLAPLPGPRIWSPALEKLVELGAVEARIVEARVYYAYLADLQL